MTIPWNKGKTNIYSEETLKKMSLAKIGKPSPRKGVYVSEETRRKISESNKGRKVWNKGLKFPYGTTQPVGENNPNWKGDKVGYQGLHAWVHQQLGKANHCSNKECKYPRIGYKGKILMAAKKFEWSNISGKYKRDLTDWQQLCHACHDAYDKNR